MENLKQLKNALQKENGNIPPLVENYSAYDWTTFECRCTILEVKEDEHNFTPCKKHVGEYLPKTENEKNPIWEFLKNTNTQIALIVLLCIAFCFAGCSNEVPKKEVNIATLKQHWQDSILSEAQSWHQIAELKEDTVVTRYFMIVYHAMKGNDVSDGNLFFEASALPNNLLLKEIAWKQGKNKTYYSTDNIIVTNIIEFKNKEDYNSFAEWPTPKKRWHHNKIERKIKFNQLIPHGFYSDDNSESILYGKECIEMNKDSTIVLRHKLFGKDTITIEYPLIDKPDSSKLDY